MSRVLALGCLAVLFLAGRPAWAEDPAPPPPPPAPAGGAVLEAPTETPPPPPAPKGAPEVIAGTEGESKLATSSAGVTYALEELGPDSLLEAIPPGPSERVCCPWTGNVRLRYRARVADDDLTAYDVDQDLWLSLRLKWRDEAQPGWSGSMHGRLFVDLDHFGDVVGYNVWDSVWDTWDDRWNGQLFHAYVNYRFCKPALDTVRVGRMWEDIGEYVTFDGLRIETGRVTSKRLGAAAIVGVPTYFYDRVREGNFLAGLQLFGDPWRGAEVELDWSYLRNDRLYGDVDQNLFNVLYNQRIGQYSLAQFQYQQLDDEPRLFRAIGDAVWPNADVAARGYFYTLINPQAELVYDLDAYYWVQLDLEPYWEANISASKGIGNCFQVEGGVALRRLYDTADESRYNREWERYYVSGSSFDWLVQGLSLTVSGELWSGSDDIATAVFDVEYRPSRVWRFVLGTDFAAYSFDMYAFDERQNVYSAFGRVTWRPTPRWDFDFRARVSDDDFGTYLTFDASAGFNF